MKVQCKICKRYFETLNSHMHRSHGITVREYLERYPNSRWCSDEYQSKQSKAMTRRNCNLEFSAYISARNKKNWQLDDYREKQVLAMIKKCNSMIKGQHYSEKCKSYVAYKSKVELDYAKYLDSNPSIVQYDSESLAIPYDYKGTKKLYIPDFIVTYTDGHIEVVELKPKNHHAANDRLLKYKYVAAYKYCREHGYIFIVEGNTEWYVSKDNSYVSTYRSLR